MTASDAPVPAGAGAERAEVRAAERCGVPCDEGKRPDWWAPCDREVGHDGPHTWPLDPPPMPTAAAEVRVEWGVRCPTEGFVQVDSELDALAWLIPDEDHHPGEADVIVHRTVTTSPWEPV